MNTTPHTVPVIVERECQLRPGGWAVPSLLGCEIHIWQQSLNLAPDRIQEFHRVLSVDERNRAQRFRFDTGRMEFVVSRGTLRLLLEAYQGIPANEMQFAYSKYGRPRLSLDANREPIEFNISHCSGVTLLAFARGYRIGVDIERVRRDFDVAEIAESFFSQSECAVLRALPAEMRQEAFFRCWTRKEAFIKALGEGLSHPLDAFDVSLAPSTPPALLATRPNGHEAGRWSLRDVAVPKGYVAALAVEIEPPPI